MSLVRAFVRWGCCTAAIASLAVPAYPADKKAKEAETTAEAPPSYYGPQPAIENIDLTMYARIREEGFHHSHVMEFGGALSDGIGPRLTGSPNMAKANQWTCDTLTKIGLENAHLEDWGEFGMGWQQINTWARIVSPDPEPLWMQAAPWSPSIRSCRCSPPATPSGTMPARSTGSYGKRAMTPRSTPGPPWANWPASPVRCAS